MSQVKRSQGRVGLSGAGQIRAPISKLGQFPGFTLGLTLDHLHNSITKKCVSAQSQDLSFKFHAFKVYIGCHGESILVPEVRAWWPPPFRFAALQPETPQKRLACYSPPTPFTVKKSPWFSIASSSIADHTLAIACSSSNLALRIGDLHLGIKACMRSALGVWKVGGGHSTWYRRRFLGIGSTYWGRRRQHPAISAL